MERVQLILAEPAVLLVAQWRGDAVLLEPGSDARQVVLIDEGQAVGLERTAEVDSDGTVGCVVCLLFHSAAVLRVKHLSLRCGKRDTPVGHRQDKVENAVDLVGMSGCHNFAA